MKEKYYYQFGYGGLGFLLAGAVIAAVAYFFIYPATLTLPFGEQSKETCYTNPPDTSHSITENDTVYNLLKAKAPIPSVQFFNFVDSETSKQTLNGKERSIMKANIETDGKITSAAWRVSDDDKSALDLRFVDITDEIGNATPGISYVNIYLKDGAEIPLFIENFCRKNTTLVNILLLPDNNENSFPPFSIDVSKITNWECFSSVPLCNDALNNIPTTGKYYLYTYDTPGNYLTDYIETTREMPFGSIDLTHDGETNEYKTVYGYKWGPKHIGVYGTDPQDPSQAIIYRYIKEDFLKLEQQRNPYLRERVNTIGGKQNLHLEFFMPSTVSHTGWWTPE